MGRVGSKAWGGLFYRQKRVHRGRGSRERERARKLAIGGLNGSAPSQASILVFWSEGMHERGLWRARGCGALACTDGARPLADGSRGQRR